MKNIRFKDDEKLSEIYEKVNLSPFRNYVYNFDGLGTYCNYLDEYECAIGDRDDKIEKYKEVIDKLKEWINIVQQNKDNKHLEPFISTDELDELLDILKEVK